MRPGEHASFAWRPEEPASAFECVLITRGQEVPLRAFAVTVAATDADGQRIAPTGKTWTHSESLKSFYQYAPASKLGGTSRLKPWSSETIAQDFYINAVAWHSDGSDIPDVVALAVSAIPIESSSAQTWQLLRPLERSDA